MLWADLSPKVVFARWCPIGRGGTPATTRRPRCAERTGSLPACRWCFSQRTMGARASFTMPRSIRRGRLAVELVPFGQGDVPNGLFSLLEKAVPEAARSPPVLVG